MSSTVSDGAATSSTITKVFKEHHPSSYGLKIENITLLNDEKYQSRRFYTGGHNWRLIIYTKGNKDDNGSGFISMYVEKVDTTSEVFAYLKFFIYNNKEHKYFTIQDTEVKRFNGLRMVSGIAQVLPLDLFNDTKNGYIFDGNKCEFGVDVIMAPPPTNKWEIISFNDHFQVPKFSWTVTNFSKLKDTVNSSSSFSRGGKNWVLYLYPKGTDRGEEKWLSIFLRLAESETIEEDEKIFTKGHIRVIDPSGSNHLSRQINIWHTKSNKGWGFINFLSLEELRKVYLDDKDSLRLEMEFDVVSATKYSSP